MLICMQIDVQTNKSVRGIARMENELGGAIRRPQNVALAPKRPMCGDIGASCGFREVSGAMQHPKELCSADVTMFLAHLGADPGNP